MTSRTSACGAKKTAVFFPSLWWYGVVFSRGGVDGPTYVTTISLISSLTRKSWVLSYFPFLGVFLRLRAPLLSKKFPNYPYSEAFDVSSFFSIPLIHSPSLLFPYEAPILFSLLKFCSVRLWVDSAFLTQLSCPRRFRGVWSKSIVLSVCSRKHYMGIMSLLSCLSLAFPWAPHAFWTKTDWDPSVCSILYMFFCVFLVKVVFVRCQFAPHCFVFQKV